MTVNELVQAIVATSAAHLDDTRGFIHAVDELMKNSGLDAAAVELAMREAQARLRAMGAADLDEAKNLLRMQFEKRGFRVVPGGGVP